MNTPSIPTLDLDVIATTNTDLKLVVRDLLTQYDTFLLKNYANKNQLDEFMEELNYNDPPNAEQGFDANFTGTVPLFQGDPGQNHDPSILLEQYIYNTDEVHSFGRACDNESLSQLFARLFQIGLYFAQICLEGVVLRSDVPFNSENYSSILTRYYTPNILRPTSKKEQDDFDMETEGDDELNVLYTGDHLSYYHSENYITFNSPGLITIFPHAVGIKYKPPTSSMDDNTWVTINKPDCILIHTGDLLAKWSNGLHQTSPLKIATHQNVIHCTFAPPLNTKLSNSSDLTLSTMLLDNQMLMLPALAKQFYSRDHVILKLEKDVHFLKNLFNITETVLSLDLMSRSNLINKSIELYRILPQISNMIKKKITEEMLLKLLTIWPKSYIIESNIRSELSIKLPKIEPLVALTTKSRKLQFIEFADQWLEQAKAERQVPTEVPVYKINKRQNSIQGGPINISNNNNNNSGKRINNDGYLFNTRNNSNNIEKEDDSQQNLLERIRSKERSAEQMLNEREEKYRKYLRSKLNHIYEILFSLTWNEPYTETHLTSLIVDSLQDTNNPIGDEDCIEVLKCICATVPDQFKVHSTDGGLKVYRWDNLDKNKFHNAVANMLD